MKKFLVLSNCSPEYNRIVEADDISEVADHYHGSCSCYGIIEISDEQPTVDSDAVPVVRCKDCKYAYMTDDGYCNWCDIMADLLGLDYDDIHLPGDWFCADGEKVKE